MAGFESLLGLGQDDVEDEESAAPVAAEQTDDTDPLAADAPEGEDAEAVGTDGDEDGSGDEPDPQAMLQAIQALQTRDTANAALMQNFTRTVGRVQSLMDRMDKTDPTEGLRTQVDEQIGGVTELLGQLVEGLGEDVLDANTKNRVDALLQGQRATKEQDSLVARIVEQLGGPQAGNTQAPVQPVESSASASGVSSTEQDILAAITKAGFVADDFDWNEANTQLSAGGNTGVTLWFGEQIAAKRSETQTGKRRQDRKDSAGSTPGAASGGSETNTDGLDASGGKFKDAIANLETLLGSPL
mgnify:CR=1 FL=1